MKALSPWKILGGDPIGRMSTFAAGGCAGACPPTPPGDPPPPRGPPPPGGPPPPEGGGYFFMALPSAFATHSSLVGMVIVKAAVSVSAVVALMAGVSMIRLCQGGNIAFGANELCLILWSIAFCIDSSILSSVSGRLFAFSLLVVLCSS